MTGTDRWGSQPDGGRARFLGRTAYFTLFASLPALPLILHLCGLYLLSPGY